jgi:hypothetical protein
MHHQHPAPPTPEGLSRLLPGSSPLPWPSLSLTSSAPSGSRCRAKISTLPCERVRHSLHVTGCCFALLPQEDTPLQHYRSSTSTGSLLRGLLAVTTVGLSPTSRRQLIRAHQRVVGRRSPKSNSNQAGYLPIHAVPRSSHHAAWIALRTAFPLPAVAWAQKFSGPIGKL